jgi:hypothetical protein
MAISKMQEPMYSSETAFNDRVPFWWKNAPLIQSLYRSELFNILMVIYSTIAVVGVLMAIPLALLVTPALAWFAAPMLLASPYVGLSAYLKAVHRPIQGYKEYRDLRVDQYRKLPDKQRKEFKPMAKLLRADPSLSILKDYQYIIDNQKVVAEVERIPSKIKAKIEIAKDDIETAKQAQEIMRERGWDKEIV